MTDDGWFRLPGGPRSRPPAQQPSQRSEPAHEALCQEEQILGDYHGLQRTSLSRLVASSGSGNSSQKNMSGNEGDPWLKSNEEIWHNPSVGQIAEALRVKMMTKLSNEHLPLEYHAYVLHVIEGYGLVKEKLDAVENQLAKSEKELRDAAKRCQKGEEDWLVREAQYIAEIKKLEGSIPNMSSKGLETRTKEALVKAPVHKNAASSGTMAEYVGPGVGYHRSILSRPRLLDSSRDIHLSKRLSLERDHGKKSQPNIHMHRREGIMEHSTTCRAVSTQTPTPVSFLRSVDG